MSISKVEVSHCEEISTMMAGMETKIANIDTKMANINTEMKNMNTKMAHRDTKLKNVETKIANIDTKTANTDTKLENMNTKMANLQANVEAKFEAVNNEVRGMRMSLNEVKDGFDHLKEAVLEKIESKEGKQEEITRDVSGTASGGRENQHIFVAGGWRRNSVEIFNYRQRLWSLLKPMPENRSNATSFVYNNHVTVAGGSYSDGVSLDNMIRMNIHPVPDLSINWSDFAAKLPVRMWDTAAWCTRITCLLLEVIMQIKMSSLTVFMKSNFNHLTQLNCYPGCLNQDFVTTLSYVTTAF